MVRDPILNTLPGTISLRGSKTDRSPDQHADCRNLGLSWRAKGHLEICNLVTNRKFTTTRGWKIQKIEDEYDSAAKL